MAISWSSASGCPLMGSVGVSARCFAIRRRSNTQPETGESTGSSGTSPDTADERMSDAGRRAASEAHSHQPHRMHYTCGRASASRPTYRHTREPSRVGGRWKEGMLPLCQPLFSTHTRYMTSRVVLTQTQHIPGLVWVLRQVLSKTPAIQTIVPAKIINTNKHRRVFDLKVTTPTPTGHKALARYQHRAQEVAPLLDHPESLSALLDFLCDERRQAHVASGAQCCHGQGEGVQVIQVKSKRCTSIEILRLELVFGLRGNLKGPLIAWL